MVKGLQLQHVIRRHVVTYDATSATIGDLLTYARQEFSIADLTLRGAIGSPPLSSMNHSTTINAAGFARTILVAI